MNILPPTIPLEQLETRQVLRKLTTARAALAELKGMAGTIPNERILIDTLSLQEAKDSSEIENIITTHDEIYGSQSGDGAFSSPAAKEVHRYAEALKVGFEHVRTNGFIHLKLILTIQEQIEGNSAGIRRQPGTKLVNDITGETVYTPPQDYDTIMGLMGNLEQFINDQLEYETDPLIKMAIIHHQFESIHPFYDGNGRTGRIINILYLIQKGLLNLPILYISRYIIRHRQEYYRLLQTTRDRGTWEEWVIYMLDAVEKTALDTTATVKAIKSLMQQQKQRIRSEYPRIYSQDLINNLFRHPYTKIALLERDLGVTRLTARKYLETLCEMGILTKTKVGRSNFYLNKQLFPLLQGVA
jgi:Fic family protein